MRLLQTMADAVVPTAPGGALVNLDQQELVNLDQQEIVDLDGCARVDVLRSVRRDRAADDRDHLSDLHDSAATERDRSASARDLAVAGSETDPVAISVRADAARDRRASAQDRAHAAGDRRSSWSDRAASAGERVVLSFDGLTGAYRRDTGLVEIDREISRARRTGQTLAVGFADVDGLKRANDSSGHAAGDRILVAVADALRARLRPYDPVVRIGGDEFVCAILDLDVIDVTNRFRLVTEDLAQQSIRITIGVTLLEPTDTQESVITRADAAMYDLRHARRQR